MAMSPSFAPTIFPTSSSLSSNSLSTTSGRLSLNPTEPMVIGIGSTIIFCILLVFFCCFLSYFRRLFETQSKQNIDEKSNKTSNTEETVTLPDTEYDRWLAVYPSGNSISSRFMQNDSFSQNNPSLHHHAHQSSGKEDHSTISSSSSVRSSGFDLATLARFSDTRDTNSIFTGRDSAAIHDYDDDIRIQQQRAENVLQMQNQSQSSFVRNNPLMNSSSSHSASRSHHLSSPHIISLNHNNNAYLKHNNNIECNNNLYCDHYDDAPVGDYLRDQIYDKTRLFTPPPPPPRQLFSPLFLGNNSNNNYSSNNNPRQPQYSQHYDTTPMPSSSSSSGIMSRLMSMRLQSPSLNTVGDYDNNSNNIHSLSQRLPQPPPPPQFHPTHPVYNSSDNDYPYNNDYIAEEDESGSSDDDDVENGGYEEGSDKVEEDDVDQDIVANVGTGQPVLQQSDLLTARDSAALARQSSAVRLRGDIECKKRFEWLR